MTRHMEQAAFRIKQCRLILKSRNPVRRNFRYSKTNNHRSWTLATLIARGSRWTLRAVKFRC